jgi:3-phytase
MALRTSAVAIGCLVAVALVPAIPVDAADRIERVSSNVETAPSLAVGDAIDDPAIWVDERHPARSLVIGNNKLGALEAYNLNGSRRARIVTSLPFWGNVDIRQSALVGGARYDVVAAMNGGLRLYSVDHTTRGLVTRTLGDRVLNTGGGEGLCLYRPAGTRRLYAFVVRRDGRVRQYQITDADRDGVFGVRQVRHFSLGSEGEGCVADDALGRVYLSEEDVALWRYDADPNGGARRVRVDRVGGGGHLVSDVEGVTLVTTGRTGYVIVSAQNVRRPARSYFVVYTRRGNAYVKSFRIVAGAHSDGCERTDGVAAYAGRLGSRFPRGVFVCQDDDNILPGIGHQDFKLTRLEKIVTLRQ